MEKFLAANVVLSLKSANALARRLILYDHYSYLTHSRPVLTQWRLRHVFLFHEAANFISRDALGNNPLGEPVLLTMLREARNHGIGFCFATQEAESIHHVIDATIGTYLILRLEREKSVDRFRRALALTDEQRHAILNLPPRHVVVRRNDLAKPFLVRIPNLFGGAP